ncbi:MAG: LLM class flavin-dependent oxidoreductase [Candidatus Pristimantibacillus lignocellulolyticus]|uniref:LLM class flavin-dependent oxidoreductase n=1 Tax=Candidatus Pristimantibacillus lignocellulolyticus TaxID=2994561 RepID=A0A9J6Z9J7_9BACL|nr:MAG: LLM class flavin-dependent oxidoreductase [Candidatus Pristimantibacillus lignocellulolyticus]
MKIGILDQGPVTKGHTPQQALQFIEELAILADSLGYSRMWMAEHHNTQWYVSTAPEILAAHLAAKTKQIRIGTGGIMMMHYSPFKMAEVFKTLAGLNPGRIDFGVGRAPGGDPVATRALAEGRSQMGMDMYEKLSTTLRLMSDRKPNSTIYDSVIASPTNINLPHAFLLGSTGNSAIQAGKMGVGYAFAHFFSGEMHKEVFEAYRSYFEPSYFMEKPLINVTYSATVAPTIDEAEFYAKPLDIWRLNFLKGQIGQILSPEEAAEVKFTEMDKMTVKQNRNIHLVGTAVQVADRLRADQEYFGFEEVMFNLNQHGQASRLQCVQLLAKELL